MLALGEKNTALITDSLHGGTSRNAGSDKQTYYKLSLSGDKPDSVGALADTLYSGGGVHGDIALAEAAGSAKCFYKLVSLGVTFPCNEFGEYVSYQTDHDLFSRATSAGPLTSKMMTEALENSAVSRGLKVFDGFLAVKLIVKDNFSQGVIALDLEHGDFVLFLSQNIILCTGGPAGIYQDTVYPEGHHGMSSLAIEAGARMSNLCEWQYGLASTKFRWNVSGTYQQVLPRYVSIDNSGREREFLSDFYKKPAEALEMVFLKGYQWPYDMKKRGGSSKIDELVHEEILKGNKVYLDYRTDPAGLDFSALSDAPYNYLKNSDALLGDPIERLIKMNQKAYELYKSHGIDLKNEMLEIAVCAQHNNGGAEVNSNWQTSVGGLYAAGEAAGTFGIYRPGGSALNSGQVGSMRAAQDIHEKKIKIEPDRDFAILEAKKFIEYAQTLPDFEEIGEQREKMSKYAAQFRDTEKMEEIKTEAENLLKSPAANTTVPLEQKLRNRDALITQCAVLSSMLFAAENFASRGGSRVTGSHATADGNSFVITTVYNKGYISFCEKCRPIPDRELWFEKVYNTDK